MKYVLITGGTSGIGYELARLFVINNYGIVIVSGNIEKLKTAESKLKKEFSANILTIEQDLSKLGAAKNIYDQINIMKIEISILVNNAGVGLVGPVEEVNMQQDENMLILNIINLVELSKLFLPGMYQKKEGGILNVASTGAFQPGPYTSTYYASKAFVLSFSKAIRYEAREKGVKVCVLCPGATKTEFFQRSGKKVPNSAMSAEKVASIAYKNFMNNKEIIVPGLVNKIFRWLPAKVKMIGLARFQMNLKKEYENLG